MMETGGGNLEERLRDARPRVLVVDDNPNDLALLLRFLNKLGEPDNLKFAGTSSPREAYERLKHDKSILAVILDISYNLLSSEEMAGFLDGTALAREISKERPELIYAFMSGGQYGGVSITSILQNVSTLRGTKGFTAWEKPGAMNKINTGVFYENVNAEISKLGIPKYPRLLTLEAPSLGGKTEIKTRLEKEKYPWLDIYTPPSNREKRLVELEDREFLESEEIHERITGTGNPLVWALLRRNNAGGDHLEERVFRTKDEYLREKDALKRENAVVYMLDLDALENSLSAGRNVLVPIRVHQVSEELRGMFGKYCHVISLYASPSIRMTRLKMQQHGQRSFMDIVRRLSGDEKEHPSDTVIDTGYPPASSEEESIFQSVNKIKRVINWLGNEPYTADIHSDYVKRPEQALVGLGATGGLKPSTKLTVPHQYSVGQETFLGRVNTNLSFTVKAVQTSQGVKSVRLAVDADLKATSPEQQGYIEAEAFGDLARFIENTTGLERAKEKPDFRGFAFTLTDGPPLLRGDNRLPYRLEVVPG